MGTRPSPGVFRFGQVFQRGDLPIFITDESTNPVSPYKITYTLYYVPPTGCAYPSGVKDRIPVQADVGEYYVSGVVGQCGQPGNWYVEWKYQASSDGVWISDKMGFKVFNTAAYCPPGPGSCGCGSSPCACYGHAGCQWCCRNPCKCSNPGSPCGGC